MLFILWVGCWNKLSHIVGFKVHVKRELENKRRSWGSGKVIPFSAFWLRSGVESVLISLIFDMWVIDSHDIKSIFWGEVSAMAACCLGVIVSLFKSYYISANAL